MCIETAGKRQNNTGSHCSEDEQGDDENQRIYTEKSSKT